MKVEEGVAARAAETAGKGAGAPVERWWLGVERKWWVLVATATGTLVSATSISGVNALVPVIMSDFKVPFSTAEWIPMAYLVVVCSLLLTFGRLGDLIGHKRVYLLGYAVFFVGSALSGLAPSALALIGVRVVQAFGSAMLFSSTPALLTMAFPGRQRGQALGILGTGTYLGIMLGPALGGIVADQLGWRWTFFIYLPAAALAMTLSYFAIGNQRPAAHGERFDPAGALSFLGGLSALLLAVSHGQEWGWASGSVLGLLAVAVVLLGAFVWIELHVAHPMLDLSLFRIRLFSAAVGSALLNYMCVYSVMFMVPFYLMQFRGMSPSQAGLLLSTQALVMAVAAPLSGTLSDRIGSRLPSSLGMAILAIAMVWLGTLSESAGNLEIAARLMLVGLGAGIFVSPNSSALMGSAPRQRQGVAGGVLAGARNTGMVLGVALAGAVFATSLAAHGGSVGPSPGFLPAFRDTFFAVALCGVAGMIASLSRGKAAR